MPLNDIYEQWRLRAASEVAQIAEAFYPPLLIQQPNDWLVLVTGLRTSARRL
jgi:hypothetical protein